MKYLITFLLLCASAHAQTYRTVTADTNNVIRTNFSMSILQLTGGFPAELLRTNGSAFALTNFPADLLRTNGDGSTLTNLPNANLTNATGILPISNGGTGATNAQLAISNLLPSYTGNSNRALALNSNATALTWTSIVTDLASTNLTGTLPITRGGTGGTNGNTAQISLGIRATGTGGAAILGAFANVGFDTNASGAAIGNNARTAGPGAALGQDSKVLRSPGIGAFGAEGGAAGLYAEVNGRGGAVGAFAYSINGFAGGPDAKAGATNSVQLLGGTNTNNNTIQFANAGSVTTNQWSALANSTTFGRYVMAAPTNGTANQILALNSNATAVVWTTNAGGGGGGLPETPLSVTNGGTGGTNRESALGGLGVFTVNGGVLLHTNSNVAANGYHIAIGNDIVATNTNFTARGVAIGDSAFVTFGGVAIGKSADTDNGVSVGGSSFSTGEGVAIGIGASTLGGSRDPALNRYGGVAVGWGAVSYTNGGAALGRSAASYGGGAIGDQALTRQGAAIGSETFSSNGIAGGLNAWTRDGVALGPNSRTTNGVQLLTGTNTVDNTIQFLSAGSVTTNQWTGLANSTVFGHLIMAAPTNGTANQILALNSNATAVVWTTSSGGGGGTTVDLASTNATGILPITKGGTGGTNTESAVLGLGILNTNDYRVNLFYGGTNAGNQHIVIGAFSSAYSTNFSDSALVIGTSAQGSNGGVSVGPYTIAQGGIAMGNNAQSEGRGVAIGNYAVALGGTVDATELGGVAIGPDATSSTNMGVAIGATAGADGNGVAIGYDADSRGGTNGGVGIGYGADVYEGIGIGVFASANNGVAIGANAVDGNEGVAIGIRASTINGAAIGMDAVSDVGYQIGTGTNGESMEPTIQFMDAGEVYTNQWTAIANSTALGHANMAAIVATNSPTNTNAPTPNAWMKITEGTNNYYLPLWQ